MKKVMMIIVAIAFAVLLGACSGETGSTSTQTEAETENTSTEATEEPQFETMQINAIGFRFDLPKDAREIEGRASGIATCDKCYACGEGDETVVVEADYNELSNVPDVDSAVAGIHAEDEYTSEKYITKKDKREGRKVMYPTTDTDGKTMYATCYVFVADDVYGEITFLQYSEDTDIQDLVLNSLRVNF